MLDGRGLLLYYCARRCIALLHVGQDLMLTCPFYFFHCSMVVRIMLMVPIYGIASFISLFSLDAAVVIDAIRDIYEVCFLVYLLPAMSKLCL